jgi:hypothetical protein
MKGKEFTCSLCGDNCISTWSDEDAIKEYEKTFGEYKPEEAAVLCDDCHKTFMEWYQGYKARIN